MAYYFDEDEKDEENKAGPVALGAESGVIGSDGAGATDEVPGSSASTPKSSFAGITDYINANKPQSEKLAGQVAGNINQKAGEVDSELSSAQNSFNQQAEGQQVQQDDNLLNQVRTDATQVVGDAGKKSSFEKMRDAQYTGPSQLEDIDSGGAWANIQNKLLKARAAKDSVNTEEGRMGLIKEISNNPRQSQGALTFDNLLLQSNPNAAGMLQNAGSNLNDFDARLGSASEAAKKKASDIAAANAATNQAARGSVSQGLGNLFGASAGEDKRFGTEDDVDLNLADSLSGRAKAKQAEQGDAYDKFKRRIATGDLTAEDLAEMGLSGGTPTLGQDLVSFVNPQVDANTKNVANDEDYARLAALEALQAGNGESTDFLNPATDKALIGTAGKGYGYDSAGAKQAIAGRQRDFTNKLGALINERNQQDDAIPENTEKWVQWLLNGTPIPGFNQQAIINFAQTPFGQKLLKLGNEYEQSKTPLTTGGMRGSLAGPLGKKV